MMKVFGIDQRRVSLMTMLCFVSQICVAQGFLRGVVTDAKTGEPLLGATVTTGSSGAATEIDGGYLLELSAGTYVLNVSFTGYEGQRLEVTIVNGVTQERNVALVPVVKLLETTTVTASRFQKPLAEVTVSLEVVKPYLIDNTNATKVDNVLQKVPGVSIIDGQANIRGGSGFSYGAGSRVLLLMDDMPIMAGDAGFPNWSDIPVENIEQVEVLKGAASALFGSSALNGIINIRTAYPKAEPVTRLAMFNTLFFSPRDTAKRWWDGENSFQPMETGAQFAHRQRFGKLDVVFGGNYRYYNSFRQEEFERRGRINFNTRYRISDRLAIGVNANANAGNSRSYFFWRDSGAGALDAFPGSSTPSKVRRFNIDPFVNYFDHNGGSHKLLSRFFSVSNDNGNNQGNQSQLYYGEYQYQKSFEQLGDLQVATGVVGTYVYSQAQLYGNSEYTVNNGAWYLQLDKKIGSRLNLSGGVRYEMNVINSPDSITVTPTQPRVPNDPRTTEAKPVFRFGANYQPADYTYVRASFGQGYRYPTIAEKFVSTAIGGALQVRPNPNLESETGWSAEVGIKQGFQLTSQWQGFLDVAGFWTEYQNMMEFTFRQFTNSFTDFGFQSLNIGNTMIRGIDVSLVGQGKIGEATLNLLAGYTYIDPRFKDFTPLQDSLSSADYNVLKYRFRHTVKLDVEATYRKFSFGASVLYNSFMEAVDQAFLAAPVTFDPGVPGVPPTTFFVNIIPGLEEYRARNNKGIAVLDLRGSVRVKERVKLTFILANALNEEYAIRPALLEAPRNATFRLDYNF